MTSIRSVCKVCYIYSCVLYFILWADNISLFKLFSVYEYSFETLLNYKIAKARFIIL